MKFNRNLATIHWYLLEAINSYKTYEWIIPNKREEFIEFINKQGKLRNDTKDVRFFSILKTNLIKLKDKLMEYNINAKIYGPLKNNRGRIYYCLSFKQKELIKLRR